MAGKPGKRKSGKSKAGKVEGRERRKSETPGRIFGNEEILEFIPRKRVESPGIRRESTYLAHVFSFRS
jgi:hypothetical protein